MNLILSYDLNPSKKVHLFIGLLMGLWVYVFLGFIGPFDTAPLNFPWRLQLMSGYGVLFALSYILIIPIQDLIKKYISKWNVLWEMLTLLTAFLICLPISFIYYKSDWVVGEFSFSVYAIEMYVPTCLVILPLMIITRKLVSKKYTVTKQGLNRKITLSGQNKLDVLQIDLKALIAIKSAGNYVEVYYLIDNKLNKKLLRSTLKVMLQDIPEIIQVHRSFLVNPDHFVSWKDKLNIHLGYLDVPVSEAFRNQFLSTLKIHHKKKGIHP